ncbi:alpha/beta fold hydrolase [Streptomyces sp. NPDC032940]|uniref:thioesterase II family protein n=1 Tax=Streptomyces sp. NPDC032940 TaxID=3155366 RepID=UPI0033EC61E0
MRVRPTAKPLWWSRLRPLREPGSAPRARLLVVPHSGGGPNRYLRLFRDLPDDVEILGLTLPGRERRVTEPPGAGLDEVLDSLATIPGPEVPAVVLGHSLGATVGLHLAHALGRHCLGLIASGQEPRDSAVGWLTEDSGDEDVLRLLELGGDKTHLAIADAEWRAALLDTLRADLRLGAESSERSGGVRIDAPITVLCGREDRLVDLAALEGWGAYSAVGCEVHVVPGGHFALFDSVNRPRYLEAVERRLSGAAHPSGRPPRA